MCKHLPVFLFHNVVAREFLNRAMTRGDMHHTHGSIEVVCGSMFSGKTDELIRRLVRATIAKQKVQVFKPAIDIRYAVEKVTSHAGANYDAIPVSNAANILEK
jgi:thymidine kinase